MKKYDIEFKVKKKFSTHRRKEVLAVIMFPDGKILVSTKEVYPEGVYRLTTGGMESGETPEESLKREIYEETGITEFESTKLAEIYYDINGPDGQFNFETHIFLVKVEDQEIKVMDPNEKLSGFKKINIEELKKYTEKFLTLEGVLKKVGVFEVSWLDWRRFRAIAHDIVIKELIK